MERSKKRTERLMALNALLNGSVKITDLEPGRVFLFTDRSDRPGVYFLDGKEYNESEYNNLCEEIKSRKNGSVIWNESKQY